MISQLAHMCLFTKPSWLNTWATQLTSTPFPNIRNFVLIINVETVLTFRVTSTGTTYPVTAKSCQRTSLTITATAAGSTHPNLPGLNKCPKPEPNYDHHRTTCATSAQQHSTRSTGNTISAAVARVRFRAAVPNLGTDSLEFQVKIVTKTGVVRFKNG